MSHANAVRWVRRHVPVLAGQTILVTGASSGLGAACARLLAERGAQVVLAVRNPQKAAGLAAELGERAEVRRLDLGSLASIRTFAREWSKPADVLINNAGVIGDTFVRTVDGIEEHFAVNHLGAFLLTGLLMPHIRRRVVLVSSHAHRVADSDWDATGVEAEFDGMNAYARSKLANLLFMRELAKRLERAGSPVSAMAAHPGLAHSNLLAKKPTARKLRITRQLQGLLGQSPAMGALPLIWAATGGVPNGAYVGPGGFYELSGYPRLVAPRPQATDDRAAAELWALSERLAGFVRSELSQSSA